MKFQLDQGCEADGELAFVVYRLDQVTGVLHSALTRRSVLYPSAQTASLRSQTLRLAIELQAEFEDVARDAKQLVLAVRRAAALASKSRLDQESLSAITAGCVLATKLEKLMADKRLRHDVSQNGLAVGH